MLTYSEVIVLRDKLASGEIGLEFAQAQYWKNFKEGQKSWDTKDWKERRSKIIKDKCEICDSKDTLTIQHRTHPKKYAEYLRDVTRVYADAYINMILNVLNFNYLYSMLVKCLSEISKERPVVLVLNTFCHFLPIGNKYTEKLG